MEDFKAVLQRISEASLDELYILKESLSARDTEEKQEIYTGLSEQVEQCPHCQSSKIIKWGTYKDKIRYMCKSCKRTFIPTTGTALHCLKKPDMFLNYVTVMLSEGFDSLASEAKRIGISKTTAFEWRHRLLISLGSEAPCFNGLTEMDDIWFRYSQKGRKGLKYSRKRGRSSHKGDNGYKTKLLIAKERDGELDMSVVTVGRLSAKDISNRLNGKFGEDSILISDKHPSISKFSNTENIKHENFTAKLHVKDEIWHVQTVNRLASAIKSGINHQLRGVSTKYLQNYATWFSMMEKYKSSKDKVKEIIMRSLSNLKAWDMNTNIEKLYEQFILNHSARTYRCPTKKKCKSQNWNFENAREGVFL